MSFIEENSAIVDKQQLLDMYHQAVNFAPYSFFYVNMNSKDINNVKRRQGDVPWDAVHRTLKL